MNSSSRVEVICRTGKAVPAAVRIDGRKPSEFAELYGFTRAVTKPEGKWLVKWPVIAPVGSQVPLLVEDWTLAVTRDAANDKLFTFALEISGGDATPIATLRVYRPALGFNKR